MSDNEYVSDCDCCGCTGFKDEMYVYHRLNGSKPLLRLNTDGGIKIFKPTIGFDMSKDQIERMTFDEFKVKLEQVVGLSYN